MRHQEIVILDFGSQYTHLIARRIRELSVFSRILPPDTPADTLTGVLGVILSGGPQSVVEGKIAFDRRIFSLGVPVLGVCYGHQLMAHELGGEVQPGTTREYGLAVLQSKGSALFTDVSPQSQVWMSHGDSVARLPEGFTVTGTTDDCPVAAMADERRKLYGVQFHPEVVHTAEGMTILKNFVLAICAARQDWTSEAVLRDIEKGIIDHVGNRNVFLLVSGGVDSTVCFALLEKVLGKGRVIGLHIDSGLMRYRESAQVREALDRAGFTNLHVIDARETFLSALSGITDPEEKRRIIGETFLGVQESAIRKMKLDPDSWLLGQGTIYPDTIETGRTQHADVIKTHHNRIPEIQRLVAEGKVVEPLKDLYKDEVRKMGEQIGLPHELVWRHPFPGPGLGIRILCARSNEEGLGILEKESQEARIALVPLLQERGINNVQIGVLPLRSVGVQGDQRSYRHPLVIMETDNIQAVGSAAPSITNTFHLVNRVILLVGGEDSMMSKAHIHAATVDVQRVSLVQKIDRDINALIVGAGLENEIWQFPIVLVPFGVGKCSSIVLRPVASQEAMTANFFTLPDAVLTKIVDACLSYPEVSFIFYDVTNKPPGTIEWE